MIEHSASIVNLMTALLAVQGKVDGVRKDSKNPHFKNSYASLEAVVDTIRQPCQDAGIVIMQAPGEYVGTVMSLTTMLVHAKSGEWLKSTIQTPVSKADPQGVGSALTYSERYSLMALFNLPAVDDDGEGARHTPPPRTISTGATMATQNNLLKDQLEGSIAVERAKKDNSPVTPHVPPYAADLDRFRQGADKVTDKDSYHKFANDEYFNGLYTAMPVSGQAQARAILAAVRKRVGLVSAVEAA